MHLPCIFDGHLTVLKIKARHVTGCPITVLCKELCANMCSFILLKPFSYIFMSFQFQAYHHFHIQTPPYNCVPTSSIWTWDGLHAKEDIKIRCDGGRNMKDVIFCKICSQSSFLDYMVYKTGPLFFILVLQCPKGIWK